MSSTLWCAGDSRCRLPAPRRALAAPSIDTPVLYIERELCLPSGRCIHASEQKVNSKSNDRTTKPTLLASRDDLAQLAPLSFPYDYPLAGIGGRKDPRGHTGPSRALVKDQNAALVLNYAGDFRQVRVDSGVTAKRGVRTDQFVSTMKDTRARNDLPSHYRRRTVGVTSEFKQSRTVGLDPARHGTFCVVDTQSPWPDTSGGRVRQTAYTDAGLVYRVGLSNDAGWQAWV